MNKITVIGDTASGKTCFLYAMYNFISEGYVPGFTIATDNISQDNFLEQMYDRLSNGELGLERFPAPSNNREIYNFKLQYSFQDVAEFEWVDYPGSDIKDNGEGSQKLVSDLSDSQAWVIFIDGDKLANVILEPIDSQYKKLVSLCGKYNRFIAKINKSIPKTVPIIITKGDLLMSKLCSRFSSDDELFEQINSAIINGFSGLFGEMNDIIKSISLVSLGDTISENNYSGELCPENIDYPITLSVLSILGSRFTDRAERLECLREKISKEQDRLFTRERFIREYEAEMRLISPDLPKWSSMASAMLRQFSDKKSIWKGNKPMNFKEYYKKQFLILD